MGILLVCLIMVVGVFKVVWKWNFFVDVGRGIDMDILNCFVWKVIMGDWLWNLLLIDIICLFVGLEFMGELFWFMVLYLVFWWNIDDGVNDGCGG